MNATANIAGTSTDLQAWFGVARHTYAVIDTQAIPQIETMLVGAGAIEWSRLPRGAAPAEGTEAWCVQLTPELPFSRWLLAGDGAALDDWGVLACSDAPFRDARQHFRNLLDAQLPGSERVALRWYRPQVLHTLLPLCSGAQLTQFFGPVRAFATAEREGWRWLRQVGGQLDTQSTVRPRAQG